MTACTYVIALYTANAYNAEREMSASACTRSVAIVLSWRPGAFQLTLNILYLIVGLSYSR